MKTPVEYYILGRYKGIDLTYWNLDSGWVTEFADGSPFTAEILSLPLPEGSIAVMAFSSDSEPLAQYDLVKGVSVGEGLNFFKKSY